MLLVAGGLALGFVLAMGASRLMASLLYRVAPNDPVAYLTAVGLLVAVGAVACYVPARRASRADPTTALRA